MKAFKEYELFTKRVYELLSQSKEVNTFSVKHDEKIKGLSGQKHQIDVLWEYEKDGKVHRVAIECKNYSRRVTKEKVCAFNGVLIDLEGVSGIMVTKVGFQKGAKQYAQQFGISLKELREPGEGETIIGTLESNTHLEMHYTLFLIDEDWAEKHNINLQLYRERNAASTITKAEMWRTATHLPLVIKDPLIRDANGNKIASLDELEKQIPDHPTEDFPFVFKFDDAYIDSRYWGPVRILEVKYDYEIKGQKKTFDIDAGDFVKAILKDAQSSETDLVVLR